ncbi:MAG: ATP-binding protein [Cardiobacteriaceae bacterium]|nr:ATP-binding protein [Cardiobacteriaceae bacterium]
MKQSLKFRLMVSFLAVLLGIWLLALGLVWWRVQEEVNELFDAQQMLLAERLATLDLPQPRRDARRMPQVLKVARWHDDERLSFAVFTPHGDLLLSSGDNPKRFVCQSERGFHTQWLGDEADERWRIFCLPSIRGRHMVAVGQEEEYRQELILEMVWSPLSVWLLGLPVLLLLMWWVVSRELHSLGALSKALSSRSPEETTNLPLDSLPSEIVPLVQNLNHFFARTHQQITRERRFTSDAAHELRSPIAALRIQTEIAQLSHNDPETHAKALSQLTTGLDRLHQMLEQLLMLSRLDSLTMDDSFTLIDWQSLIENVLAECFWEAEQKSITLSLSCHAQPKTHGQALLLASMVRNGVDNAIRHGREGSQVWIELYEERLEIADSGGGVSDEVLHKLGQRFYRPPRLQHEQRQGSGLGLSIMKRIAELHRFTLEILHHPREQGLLLVIHFKAL